MTDNERIEEIRGAKVREKFQEALEYLNAVEIEDGYYAWLAWKGADRYVVGNALAVEHAAFGNHAFAAKPKIMQASWLPGDAL